MAVAIVSSVGIALPLATYKSANLRLYVVFTTLEGTKAALQVANGLARDLAAKVTLVVLQIVPYPLPLDRPPVHSKVAEKPLSELASGQGADISVSVYLCRDREETLRQKLPADSVVLIGTRRRWLDFAERALAGRLRHDGHHVIVVEPR